jgi:hypothetical protein
MRRHARWRVAVRLRFLLRRDPQHQDWGRSIEPASAVQQGQPVGGSEQMEDQAEARP